MYHLDNNRSICAIMPTMMRREEIYMHKLILRKIRILVINNYEVQTIKYCRAYGDYMRRGLD
jgi:hypothetical protein